MSIPSGVADKILWYRYPEEQSHAQNVVVSHGVIVRKLYK
jgi:hypothetical protein